MYVDLNTINCMYLVCTSIPSKNIIGIWYSTSARTFRADMLQRFAHDNDLRIVPTKVIDATIVL